MIRFRNCKCKVEEGKFNIGSIPMDCPAVWNLIGTGNTIGIFQLETKLGQDWSRKVQPQNIEELAALTALLRPGPLEANISNDYVDIKFGKKKIQYLHPKLQPILEKTYGQMVYQEQALKIATDIAGFSAENADSLRKAIGKKNPKLMTKMRDNFIEGCKRCSNITQEVAEQIFSWIEKCQRYSFNRPHGMSYGHLAYQTAWVKCHFPLEFFTSYLIFSQYKSDPKEEIYRLVQNARLFGINISPPAIYRGNIHFQIVNANEIAFGLAHIKEVGKSAIQKIIDINNKDSNGLRTWADFLSSVPGFHRNVGIALIKAGACDSYNMGRNEMIRELEVIWGTTGIDNNGKKVKIKGLTTKEKEFFFNQLKQGMNTLEILYKMAESPSSKTKNINQMCKIELIEAAKNYLGQIATIHKHIKDGDSKFIYIDPKEKEIWLDNLSTKTKKDLSRIMIENGYRNKIVRSPCANNTRRKIILQKANILQEPINDTNIVNAAAEKHFLGIALSCSPVDDINNNLATHTCLDIARSSNNQDVIACIVIDNVKYIKTKKGKNPGQPMCFLTISDSTYSIDSAVVFPKVFNKVKAFCKEDTINLIYGIKQHGSLIVQNIRKLI